MLKTPKKKKFMFELREDQDLTATSIQVKTRTPAGDNAVDTTVPVTEVKNGSDTEKAINAAEVQKDLQAAQDRMAEMAERVAELEADNDQLRTAVDELTKAAKNREAVNQALQAEIEDLKAKETSGKGRGRKK